MASGPDVGVRFSAEELAVIDAIAEAQEWSRAQVVRAGFKRALAAGLIAPPAHTPARAAPLSRQPAAPVRPKP